MSRDNSRLALAATIHCLTGCAIGEVLGMALGAWLAWPNVATIVISIVLAFFFGYGLTIRSLLAGGMTLRETWRIALASDTLSIAVMEIVDNLFMLIVPGAMDAGIAQPRFWGALLSSLVLAGIVALPVNAWLIRQGRGHALVHRGHHGHH
jgi:hypothetical protein